MASRRETETDFEPRHRILGAIVLVAAGFILFSVVLNEQPQRLDPGEKIVAAEPRTRVMVTTVPTRKAIAPATTPVKTKAVANPLAPKRQVKKNAKAKDPVPSAPATSRTTKIARAAPATKPAPDVKKVTRDSGKRWMVQVGTFSDPANARRLRKKLASQQFQVVTKVVALQGGTAVRVRVGPYNSRKSAITARDRIKKKNGIKGVVLAQN